MIIVQSILQASLADPPSESVVTPATMWISDLLFGPLATIIAVIAVAWFGFAMLSGRVDMRRGMSVLLGCFLLFGAKEVANGLRSAATNESGPTVASVPAPPSYPKGQVPSPNTNVFDPYTGASVLPPKQ